MGHKVNPISLRLQTNRTIDSTWYSDFNYANLSAYEYSMRLFLHSVYSSAKVFPGRIISTIFPKRHIIYNLSYVPEDVKRRRKQRKTIASLNTFSFDRKEITFVNNSSTSQTNDYSRILLLHLSQAEKRHLNIDNITTYSRSIFTPEFPLINTGLNADKVDFSNLDSLRKEYVYSSLKRHMEKYVSKKSGLTTEIFGIKTANVYQSATSVAALIVLGLEHKKSIRQIWGNILEELLASNADKHIKGIRILCAGRIGGAEMARMESRKWGSTPLHTFSEKIDYAGSEAHTVYGRIGVKVWICYK